MLVVSRDPALSAAQSFIARCSASRRRIFSAPAYSGSGAKRPQLGCQQRQRWPVLYPCPTVPDVRWCIRQRGRQRGLWPDDHQQIDHHSKRRRAGPRIAFDPRRAICKQSPHIMQAGATERGSIIWRATDVRNSSARRVGRRNLSDKILSLSSTQNHPPGSALSAPRPCYPRRMSCTAASRGPSCRHR